VRIAILGGGPAGYEAALVAVELGAEVTLVERDGIGGACVLTDCVPSKTLVSTAEVRTTVDGADVLGLTCSQAPVDAKRLNRRILDLAHAQSEDIRARLIREGVDVIVGRGRLQRPG
jgi:pyruvate/2-oxoglutarate dehydrogenase complex dihydrolipoamide dehydrogenase (E3) component